MAVVFPNFSQNQFLLQSRPKSAFSATKMDMSAFIERKQSMLGKVKVEWPTHLSETSNPTSTWLAGRKAEAEKRQQEKMEQENQGNPWLVRTRSLTQRPPANLGELVKKGLLDAAGRQEEKEEEKEKAEERVPFPLCEDVPKNMKENNNMDKMIKSFKSPWFSVPELPVPKEQEPWNPPQSKAQGVREGLLRAGGNDWKTENKNPPKSMFTNTRVDMAAWLNNTNVESKKGLFRTPVTKMSITPEPQDIDKWIASSVDQDVQSVRSEGSIITLTNSDVTIDDFDDFSDMEHELSQWICKA